MHHEVLSAFESFVRSVARDKIVATRDLERHDRYLTAAEAAAILGCKVSSIHDAVSDGRLPRNQPKGHRLLFTRAQIDEYARSRGRHVYVQPRTAA